MNIVFFGTPRFAAEVFRYLVAQKISILAVVTQPDKPQGRSLQVGLSAVKEALLELAPATPLYQPLKASDPQFLEELALLNADLFVVVAYGQILSRKLLAIPRLGCINIHASLLPKFRGAAPIQRAIFEGETETGIAIQKMVYELDAGDIIASQKIPLPSDMTAGELESRLCTLSQPLLLSVLHHFDQHTLTPQDPTHVTYASKLQPAEGEIDWRAPAQKIHNLIRAFSPRPGAWCWVEVQGQKKRLKITRSKLTPFQGPPATLDLATASVACQDSGLELLEVQLEGKNKTSGREWLRGARNVKFL